MGQLSADSSSTEALCCLISVQWLELVYEMATFYRFAKVFEENFDQKWIIKILRRLNEGRLRFLDLKNVEII